MLLEQNTDTYKVSSSKKLKHIDFSMHVSVISFTKVFLSTIFFQVKCEEVGAVQERDSGIGGG